MHVCIALVKMYIETYASVKNTIYLLTIVEINHVY